MERVNVFKRKRDGNVFHFYIAALMAISQRFVISSTADIKLNMILNHELARHKSDMYAELKCM